MLTCKSEQKVQTNKKVKLVTTEYSKSKEVKNVYEFKTSW